MSTGHGPHASRHPPPLPNLPCLAVKTVLLPQGQGDFSDIKADTQALGGRSQGPGEKLSPEAAGAEETEAPGVSSSPLRRPSSPISATQSHPGQFPAQPSETGGCTEQGHARVPSPTVLST